MSSNSKSKDACRRSRAVSDIYEVWRDGEGGEGLEEDLPGGKEDVGAQHEDVGEEAGSLDRRFASGLPGRFEQVEHGMPGEGEQIEGRQRHREKPLAMAEIVFEFVAVVFQNVEALVLDLPSRAAAGDDLGDIVFGDGKAGHPGHRIFDLALGVDRSRSRSS